ncbi:YgeY family selenium metabolism-linked hydrolase [candidate division KSB3 bacterium]|uniref:YgeY family selenium metabolism-linked hydrolase n=1 Tax=candidate division KSB3 bacterium TaxID=2044937 RepID=A0A9D5JSR7_9BACT|nr:YgeY family selenium metabolism-linked hydrolase [candidate division KSB3 bacterium]MBD3323359.1 YgeY family selenium metabolism-linked hydrolase [candidate division KSB3 bacterium]
MDREQILQNAQAHEAEMVNFLREIIAIPSESCQEGQVIQRIAREMRHVGFDEVTVDPMGNVLGRIGSGKTVLAIDAHVDTVGVGNLDQWQHDPYQGKCEQGIIYGRGAADQEGALPAMVYAAKIINDLNLRDDYTLYMVGSVQEEDCDGLCWQYIVQEDQIRPECVVITDSTDCQVLRGHRGRMEMGVTTDGVSCHGSAPERGENAIYKMTKIIQEIERLHERLRDHDFLGKGTLAVTYIDCKTPSLNAIPDQCYIHLDRRLTVGDTNDSAVAEVQEAIRRAGVEARVTVPTYDRPSYTGLVYETEKYFPTWILEEDQLAVRSAVQTCESLFDEEVGRVGRWVFSTNGVSIAGMFGIPCVGFGPGKEEHAHSVTDQVAVAQVVKAAAFYAAFPLTYLEQKRKQ